MTEVGAVVMHTSVCVGSKLVGYTFGFHYEASFLICLNWVGVKNVCRYNIPITVGKIKGCSW